MGHAPKGMLQVIVQMALCINGDEVIWEHVSIEGTFAADGSALTNVVFRGDWDMRNLGAFFAELIGNSDPDEMCSLFVNLGMDCEPCHSDGEPSCLPFHIFDFMMQESHGTLENICESNCHEWCDANTCDYPQKPGECD